MSSIEGWPADDEPPLGGARPDPGNSGWLIAVGLRAMARRPAEVAVLWAASAALVFATQAVRRAVGPALLAPGLSLPWLGFEVLNVVPAAVLGTLALRLFLGGGRPWRAPDRGFWVCVGLLIAADLGSFAVGQLILAGRPPLGGPGGMALLGLIFPIEALVQAWIFTRLLLWPIGAVAGDASLTPRRSWDLTSGYVPAFIVAVILVNLPVFLVSTGYTVFSGLIHHTMPGAPTPAMAVAFALIGPPVHLLERAMAVLVYRARAARNPGLSARPRLP